MIIKNGTVFLADGAFHRTTLFTADGLVKAVGEDSYTEQKKQNIVLKEQNILQSGRNTLQEEQVIDAVGLYVIPGLVDVHTHGAMGHDFCDGDVDGLKMIASYEFRQGITSFCPTSMTLPEKRLAEIFATVSKAQKEEKNMGMARIVGIHMEGPFLAKEKCGAQNPADIIPADYEMFRRLNEVSGGQIKIVTTAPEQPGNLEFIRRAAGQVNISLGHSAADYEQAEAAFSAGANHVTHLFNAMNPYHHRNPGIIGAAAEQKEVFVEIISDGMHLHPAAVRNVFQMFDDEHVVLISDSTESCGMPDGYYTLGGQQVKKSGRKVTLANRPDEVIAGSASNLFDCMRSAVSFGIPLESAVKAATGNPAKSIGMEKKIGSFTPGAYADCLLITEDLQLRAVISQEQIFWL